MLKNKCVVLAVTGSIAAYKIAGLASMLKKQHCDVHVMMTENAVNFINPITFETLTGNKCLIDTFDRNFQFSVEHVSLAKKADVVMIAPASANVIGKLACGIADDMLTTTIMACKCKKLISPAMNVNMFENPIVQDNLKRLEHFGYEVIQPAVGYLACGDTGAGKMPEPELLYEYILREIAMEKDLFGKKVLVTAGPTQEKIDPVRYISNHSTGKMGYAIARICMLRGAQVTLVSGKTSLTPPPFVTVVPVVSAQDMFEAVTDRASQQDMIIKAAAVADYRPAHTSDEKMKKKDEELSVLLERTQDILAYLGEHRQPGQILCGFSMETSNMLENSRKKLEKKHVDMIAANNLKQTGAGFGTDTNVLTLISADSVKELPMMSKEEAANGLIDELLKLCEGSITVRSCSGTRSRSDRTQRY
ncbi:MAG: bifunctional phosphopantothenoylcysteine decarboxylase/phosphopantothenate--cysteine ligase CoaBC [Lachnospiraceae bacterium]|nr:bifunctional phosphopantothenoylcysteine decarboxylase/phosphopantothenate--cysteine ligase CoaBC [Lachnospiraceae bacterium]